MACNWSAENATNAFLKTLKMVKEQGQRSSKEPESAEFISALAAGNNSQLIVVASATPTATTSFMLSALVTAAHQTGGRVVCIHRTQHETELSRRALGSRSRKVGFVTGEAHELLSSSAQYSGADFVLIDCHLDNHEGILGAVQQQAGSNQNGAVVVGYNAFGSGSWGSDGRWRTQLLPIGEGLLVTRMAPPARNKSRWVVKVDKCTGEEHVFRIRSPQGKIEA
ncbi:unnamed protein product [Linum tenue]|uniref:Uncharacterized protein n=2 Tax=Linum tenue TaxID=586396 RepID=A0AAV0J373_9ROSI|nr:unnamed protein product [Linum tenue]